MGFQSDSQEKRTSGHLYYVYQNILPVVRKDSFEVLSLLE